MESLAPILLAAVALYFLASVLAPSLGSFFYWKQTDRVLGSISRAGLALLFGVPAFGLVTGAPFVRNKGAYVGLMIAGALLLVAGFVYDWGMSDD